MSLPILYQEMADLTQPKCATRCNIPQQCCDALHCEDTRQYALEEYGIELEDTSHPRLRFMGPNGCTVEPHLRPLCTVHLCEKAIYEDPEYAEKYFKLRQEISIAELQRLGY